LSKISKYKRINEWMFAFSTMMVMILIMLDLRMSLSVKIVSTTNFSHFSNFIFMSERNMDSNGVLVISRLSFKMEEFVCSSNNLCRDFNNFIRIMLMANFAVNGWCKTLYKVPILSSWVTWLNSSKHIIKKIQVYLKLNL